MPPKRGASRSGRAGGRGGRGGGRGGKGGGHGAGSGSENDGGNPDMAAIIAQQLAALIPNMVTQVTNAMTNDNNNGNNGGGTNGNEVEANGNKDNENGGGNGCTYKEYLACKPKEFDGKGDALAYTRWMEKMETVIDISNCADGRRVKYVTSSLSNKALTWWNTQIQARGRAAAIGMAWEDFKTKMTKEFCPNNEIQRLENEFWNHTMVGAGHSAYTDRFHELAKLVPHLVTPESKRIERYIYGLVPQIRGTVAATDPPTIQAAILKAGSLTDEMVRNGSLVREKRKEYGESSNQKEARSNSKRAKVGKVFVTAETGKKEYEGPHPKCARCNFHHQASVPCRTCTNCNRFGHFARDCKVGVRKVAPANAVNPRACFECGSPNHFRNVCPRWNRASGQGGNNQVLAIRGNNTNQGNSGNPAKGQAFVIGANEARQDPNIVTDTFFLNDHYATVLFDSGADYSFVSGEFMPLLGIEPSTLNFSYVIEMTNGKHVELNKVIRGCTLELEGHSFSIDLLPFGLGADGDARAGAGKDWKRSCLGTGRHKGVPIRAPLF